MSNELATISTAPLSDRLEYAKALATAGLLPDAFRQQPANVLVGIELADALGVAPIVVINELAVIGGKPSLSAKFMRSLVRRAGHRIRETTTPEGAARCVIIRADDPGFEHLAVWDEAKARQHGYWGKGHWQKNPSLMLSNRALSECVRLACPEVLGGVSYTSDEVADFTVEQVPNPAPQPRPAPQPEPEPDADGVTGITPEQSRRIGELMGRLSLDKSAMLDIAEQIAGRPIGAATDLSEIEAEQVIAMLDAQTAIETVDAEVVE